jgi:hypothetical protein
MLNNSVSKLRLINLLLIPILICVYLILFSNILHAQNQTLGTGKLYIWNSDIHDVKDDLINYIFTLNTFGFSFVNNQKITNLVIQTNHGDITFDNGFDGTNVTRYVTGLLTTKETIKEIEIIKAIGVSQGKMYDLTDSIFVEEFTPVKITMKSTGEVKGKEQGQETGQAGCPDKTFGSGTETGVFVSAECGDFCHIYIKRDVDGKETDFLAGDEAQEFTGKPGTKVSYEYEHVQFFSYMDDPSEGFCVETYVVNSNKAIK